jgi:hypothetical protein
MPVFQGPSVQAYCLTQVTSKRDNGEGFFKSTGEKNE